MSSAIAIDLHDPVVSALETLIELNEKAFLLCDRDRDGKLNLEGLNEAVQNLDLKFKEEEVSSLSEKLDKDNDGFITKQDFLYSFGNAYGASALSDAFYTNLANPNDEGLKPHKVHNALNALAIRRLDFTELEAKELSKLLLRGDRTMIPLDVFVRLTSRACLYVHGLSSIKPEANITQDVFICENAKGTMGLTYQTKPKTQENLISSNTEMSLSKLTEWSLNQAKNRVVSQRIFERTILPADKIYMRTKLDSFGSNMIVTCH